jgi:hypothetical protein
MYEVRFLTVAGVLTTSHAYSCHDGTAVIRPETSKCTSTTKFNKKNPPNSFGDETCRRIDKAL